MNPQREKVIARDSGRKEWERATAQDHCKFSAKEKINGKRHE